MAVLTRPSGGESLGRAVPWDLEIHTIDVGQGDSCLIVARDTVGNNHKNLLIDGGLPDRGFFVNDYVAGLAYVQAVDRILVSNYDADHMGGVRTILEADNLWQFIDELANAVDGFIPGGLAREYQVAAFAAAAAATIWGGNGAGAAAVPRLVGAAQHAISGGETDQQAAAIGVTVVKNNPPNPYGVRFTKTTATLLKIAEPIAIAATNAFRHLPAQSVFDAVVATAPITPLLSLVTNPSKFLTGGIYAAADVLDVGDDPNGYRAPAGWAAAIGGSVPRGGNPIAIGGTTRRRITPHLGDEVLWTRPGTLPPAGAPMVFLTAGTELYWPNRRFFGNEPSNDQSLGVIVRHGTFFWWSGGDLPSACEDPLGTRLLDATKTGLPDPNNQPNGTFPAAQLYAGFKCGHHGAETATDAAFVPAVHARSATVSCGKNTKYKHPRQVTIDHLHDNAPAGPGVAHHFYLTNCNLQRAHVPFSTGANQLNAVGNRSRVSGDNNPANGNAGQHVNRGDIVTRVPAASAALANAPRAYTVDYWEQNPLAGPAAVQTDPLTF
jgi:hypothetical protein